MGPDVSLLQRSSNRLQRRIGTLVLLFGVCFYMIERPPGTVYMLPAAFSLFEGAPVLLGGLGGSVPTFCHAFAFTLLTAGLLGCSRAHAAIPCLGWLSTDLAFELGQHPALRHAAAESIPLWLERLPVLGNTRAYFLGGTFDPLDLLSIVLATAAAYYTIIMTAKESSP